MQVVIFHEKVIIERIAGKVYDPRLPSGTEPACRAGDTGSIPGSGRSPGE